MMTEVCGDTGRMRNMGRVTSHMMKMRRATKKFE